MFCWNTTSFLAFRTPDVTREIKMFTSTLTCNAIAALPEMAPLIQVIPFLGTPIYHVVVISCPHCLLCSGVDVLACLPSGSGWPYRGQSPIFPDVAVGWGNFVTAAPAAPPSQMSKRSSSIPAGRTNRAKYRNENQSHQRRKDGRYEIGMGSTEAAVGRTARSPWEISAAAGKFMAEKSSSALFLLFLPLFFIFLTFSRPCQPPLFSFGVHHSKTYVSAKFLRMFDMKM